MHYSSETHVREEFFIPFDSPDFFLDQSEFHPLADGRNHAEKPPESLRNHVLVS